MYTETLLVGAIAGVLALGLMFFVNFMSKRGKSK